MNRKNSSASNAASSRSSASNGGPQSPNAARRLLARILGGGASRNEVARGRLLLEPLESRQMMAGDVEFLSTGSDASPSAIDTSSAGLFNASSMTAEGEAANDLVAFAKALDQAGVTFFGAAWCPFCTQQKELFEDGGDFLPFVEVTNPDRTLNSIGQAEGIQTFPTWDFPNGDRITGIMTLAEISAASGIPIPQGETPSFAPIGDLTLEVGSPLHIPINAYDPDDSSLTVTVSVANPSLLQGSVLQNNRSARISVANWGDMVFELFEDKAPRPTGRFIELAQSGFYDQTADGQIIFHRVIDNFVLQAGDPTGTGSGGSTLGDFDDQFHPDLQHNRTGVLSYAKSLDDTNDSQFFITEGQQRHLDYNHSIFGQLVEGDAVREAISETALSNSRPTTDIVISDVEIFQDTENSIVMLKATGASLGTTDVTITVTDGDGNSFSEVITVTVVADQDNASPFLEDIDPVTTAAGVPAVFTLDGIDVEGDPIVYEARVIDNSGATASVNQQTRQVTVTPAANFSGQILVEVAARSSDTPTSSTPTTRSSTMDLQTLAINVGPAAPSGLSLVAASDTGVSNSDGITNTAPVTFQVTGVQPGATVEILAGDTQIGIGTATATTATITTNNFAALGNATHVVTARQTVNGTTSAKSSSITVTYDTVAPATVAAIPSQASVGTAYAANLQSVEEGSGLRYALVSGPAGLTIGAQDGVIAWTPVAEQTGDQSIVVRLTDAAGNSREQTFTVNVGAEPIVAVRIEFTDLSNNVITSIAPGQEFKVRVYGDDLRPEQFGLPRGVFALYTDLLFDPNLAEAVTPNTFEYESTYSNGTSGTVTSGLIREAGGFTGSSGLGADERLVFSVRMRALAGGTLTVASDPTEVAGRELAVFDEDEAIPDNRVVYGSSSLQINANFTAVNDAATVAEDSTANSVAVLSNDTVNVSGTTLSIASVQTTSAQGGTVSISGSSLLYTPAANFNGTDTFTYVVQDQTGTQQTATVSVNVQAVNDPPTAVNDTFTASVNSSQNVIQVLSNDSSAPDTGENLRVTALGTPSNGGTVTIGTGGANVRYTPANGFIGTETFTYTVSDGSLTATGTVTVNVGAPTVGNDAFTVVEDAAVAEFNVLANDSAANQNLTLQVQSVGTSSNGTATVTSNGTRISYRPNANFFGTDQVTYTVVDSNGATGTGTITFTVTGVNDPPPAPNSAVDVIRGSSQTAVLQTTTLQSSNVDGTTEALTITAVGSTQNGGTVSITNSGKTVVYTPPSSTYTGADSFTYTVTDAAGSTTTGTLTIDVIDFTPLDYAVTFSADGGPASSGLVNLLTLSGQDFRGNPVSVAGAFDSATQSVVFNDQAPGNYEIEVPAMPFLYGREQPETLSFSTTAADTTVAPLEISLGDLHARFLSIRDFVSSAPKSYVFAAVRPGESHAWLIGTDNNNTPDNVEVSLSSDGANVTVTIDDPNVSGGRRFATIPITSTDMIDQRGETEGFRLLKIEVDQSKQAISSKFTAVPTTSANSASASSMAATSTASDTGSQAATGGEGEATLPASSASNVSNVSSNVSTSSNTVAATNTSANNTSSNIAPANNAANNAATGSNANDFQAGLAAEGEALAPPLSENDEKSVDVPNATTFDVLDSGSASKDRAAATDSAMLDLLPQLELRSQTGESLAENADQDHAENVDATLRLLGDA